MTAQNSATSAPVDPEASAKAHRAKQTLNNLLLSLLATVGIVVIMILAVPRPNTSLLQKVDYRSVANGVVASNHLPLLQPPLLGKGWYSNSARWTGKAADGVQNWYVGFVGPQNEYLGLTQGFASNPTWALLQLKGSVPTGSVEIAGQKWVVYQTTTPSNPPKTRDYALVADIQASNRQDQVLIYGTATKAQFNRFATLVAAQIKAKY